MKEVKLVGELRSKTKNIGVFGVTNCKDITFIDFQNFESAMYPNTVVGPKRNGMLLTAVDIGYIPMPRIVEIIKGRVEEWL